MINKELLKKRFSLNAKTYDKYAHVQKKMAHQLINDISSKKGIFNRDHVRILEIGSGTGYLTKELINLFPLAHITAVDLAPGMIELTKGKFKEKNIQFVCGDIEEIEIDNKYDLIISNATFQWFNRLDETINKLYNLLNNLGIMCFSTFGELTFSELHASFQKAKQRLNLNIDSSPGQSFYNLCGLHHLCQNSLCLKDVSTFLITSRECVEYEYFDTVREFFESIKKIGANNSNQGNYFMSREFLKEMINIYEKEFKENNRIKVTYHCLFCNIKKMNITNNYMYSDTGLALSMP